ncbi:11910_t:CDS:1, partial [Acaulospora colombiana]
CAPVLHAWGRASGQSIHDMPLCYMHRGERPDVEHPRHTPVLRES